MHSCAVALIATTVFSAWANAAGPQGGGLRNSPPLVRLSVAQASAAQLTGDYLPGELRARVEKLKHDVAREPTSAINRRLRASTFWDWVNAYSLTGAYVPVNATAVVAQLLAYPTPPATADRQLDAMVREFSLLDEQPNAIGTLRADPGPFRVATDVTIRQTYTVGRKPIEAGGAFMLAQHFNPGVEWQADNPRAGNFVSVTASNPDVEFDVDGFPLGGMHGGFRGAVDQLVFRLRRGRLVEGDTVTLVYGDRRRGSPGMRLTYYSSDRMPLPVYLDFDGSNQFFSLPIQPIEVTGAGVAGVRATAPSVAAVGEPFELSIRAEDRYLNRATGQVPGWTVRHDGEQVATLRPGGAAIQTIDVVIASAGVHRFEVVSTGGTLRATSNPVRVEVDPAMRIFWGDTHVHSGFAEGIGSPTRLMTWARDDARLDFIAHSEHDIWLDDWEWAALRDHVRAFTTDEFVAYLAYEWTVRNVQGGHHNVLFRTPDHRQRIGAQRFGTLSALYQGLRNHYDPADVIVIPHAHQVADARTSDAELERVVEIMSQHGTFEWFGAAYLARGHQVGLIAASDDHASQPGLGSPGRGVSSRGQLGGLAAVMAPSRSVDALFDAMRARHTYATSGPRIILDFHVDKLRQGERGGNRKNRQIRGSVAATAALDDITVLKNGREVWRRDFHRSGDDRLTRRGRYLLSFESTSMPVVTGDNPRGWRPWRGQVDIEGATIETATPLDFDHPDRQALNVADDRIDFATLTRGERSSILLQLDGIRRGTAINVTLLDTTEHGGPVSWDPHRALPGTKIEFELRNLDNGVVERELFTEPGRIDRISVRLLASDDILDAAFDFTDTAEGAGEGDYYQMRARQIDGGTAWSSPIWVGGYPPK